MPKERQWIPEDKAKACWTAASEVLKETMGFNLEGIFNGCKERRYVDVRRVAICSLKNLSSMPISQVASVLRLKEANARYYYYSAMDVTDPFVARLIYEFMENMKKKLDD